MPPSNFLLVFLFSYLSFGEVESLIQRMLRTGHFMAESLPRRASYWPIAYRLPTAHEVAQLYFTELGLNPATDKLNLLAFKHESASLTRSRVLRLWYLENKRNGVIGGWMDKWKERVQRQLRRHKFGSLYEDTVRYTQYSRSSRVTQPQH